MKLLRILVFLAASLSAFAQQNDQKLSFDFQKISVKDLIYILAKHSQKNIILSDKVPNQEISLHLQSVTWEEALSLILSSQGLSQREIGNTIIIAPIEDIAQQADTTPLASKIISLKYAKAQDLEKMLKNKENNLLSTRGNVSFDPRTNSLWIEDTPTQLSQVQTLITQLDVSVPQVSIEARVVTIDTNYEKDLGVRFGVTGNNHVSGTLEGANALAGGANAASVPLQERLNFDFPATPTAGNSGTLGLALFKLGEGYLLDLELSALEAEGGGEIIAKPSLVTANQQAATIQTGEDIPYQEKTSSGATNVAFKKAVLSLEVTPQITSDQKILLNLHISQDKPSSKLINGVPAIDTREITTQVLVNNRQTLVLGGIYEETEDHQVERVPFLSDIPLIGALFQHHHESRGKRELLIFVQPTILKS